MKKDITILAASVKKEINKRALSEVTSINPTRVPGLFESEIITISNTIPTISM